MDKPELPPTEVLRLTRLWAYDGGRTAMFELVARVMPAPKPKEPVIVFAGLPGEFARSSTSARPSWPSQTALNGACSSSPAA